MGEAPPKSDPDGACVKGLASKLGHVTIVQKGPTDIISNGNIGMDVRLLHIYF